ncbi:MAG: hypothetical protein C0404_00310 [Verrucomicrobia bacterium]|nr:hypothetical protein [Verrucomicrobiota bacterium]
MRGGEDKAWADLALLDPVDVCGRALAVFDRLDGAYVIDVFGRPVAVAPKQRTISGTFPGWELILKKLGYFSRLSILHYLIGARSAPLSGRLVKPEDLKAGPIYFTGSHVLPLEALAARYGRNVEEFVEQGLRLGGQRRSHGDAAVELRAFPRLPVTIILWREDEEFPARASLLFDASCEQHVPADILWSIAMLSVNVMKHRDSAG